MRVFCTKLVLAALVWALVPISDAYGELRTVSRNSLVFVDAVQEGGEWAAYRLADARHPVVFRAAGPGRIIFKLRTIVASDSKTAVAAILVDDRIVLTARVDPVKDAEAKLVEGGGKSVSKPRVYVVRLASGEHTVTLRYSEGSSILVAANHIAGADPGELAGEADEAPLIGPSGDPRRGRVQRIGEVPIDESDLSDPPDVPDGEEMIAAEEPNPGTSTIAAARRRGDDDAWNNVPSKRKGGAVKLDEISAPKGPDFAGGESPDPFRPRSLAPVQTRPLMVSAPWLMYQLHGGLMVSRLGLDPGAILGMDFRIPIPGLDARQFSFGASIDGSYAQGHAPILGETTRVPVGIAKMRYWAIALGADARYAFGRIEDIFEPYAGAGAGVSIGRMNTDDGTAESEAQTIGAIGLLRVGAAFGGPPREHTEGLDAASSAGRPFFELRFSGGQLHSDVTRSGAGGGGAGYLQLDAVVGYRLELLTEARAE